MKPRNARLRFVNQSPVKVRRHHQRPAMKKSRPCPVLAALAALLLLVPAGAQARPELCEAAASRAAQETGIPADVLSAIALTETGRMIGGRLRPWPWAANLEGQGHWFDTAEDALAFAHEQLAAGRHSFDLGCFQINWRWHGAQFTSPRALLDPMEGARYAARFLHRLHTEFGSWEAAAGAYHSRTPRLAARYSARFARLRAGLAAAAAPDVGAGSASLTESAPARAARINTFPLLQAPVEPASRSASLVPAALPAVTAFLPSLRASPP